MTQEALKLALEALEDRSSLMKWQIARDAVKEALAQHDSVQAKPEPEQEPVAWMYVNTDGECEQIEYGKPYDDPSVTPLYTTPPQRKPLTKDRTMEIANQTAGQYWMDEAHIQRFRAAVEAAHGIKE